MAVTQQHMFNAATKSVYTEDTPLCLMQQQKVCTLRTHVFNAATKSVYTEDTPLCLMQQQKVCTLRTHLCV